MPKACTSVNVSSYKYRVAYRLFFWGWGTVESAWNGIMCMTQYILLESLEHKLYQSTASTAHYVGVSVLTILGGRVGDPSVPPPPPPPPPLYATLMSICLADNNTVCLTPG